MSALYELKHLFLISFVFFCFGGCASTETATREGQDGYYSQAGAGVYTMTEMGDSIRPGPTKMGERESNEKQIRIVRGIVILTAIVVFFVSMIWAGADR